MNNEHYYINSNGKIISRAEPLKLAVQVTREEFLEHKLPKIDKTLPDYEQIVADYRTKELFFYKKGEKYYAADSKWLSAELFEIDAATAHTCKIINKNIDDLKSKLAKTDYVANKAAEAQLLYIATGEQSRVLEVYDQYADVLEQRNNYRLQINELQEQLNQILSRLF